MFSKIKTVLITITLWLILQALQAQIPDQTLTRLTDRFHKFTADFPREEIYTHTDREHYIAGEEMFFTVYALDRKSFTSSLNSRIAYVELLNDSHVSLIQKKILLEDGMGCGNFKIPDTLQTGVYTFRAYTNWMKNFLPENCFVKEIPVYNLLSEKISDSFPGVRSDVTGKPHDKYRETGVTLAVSPGQGNSIELLINFDEKFVKDNSRFHIIIQTHGNLNFTGSEEIHGGSASISVSKSFFIAGINQITLFNESGVPVAERYIYTPFENDNYITIRTGGQYNKRDPVTLELLSGVAASGLKGGKFSISVAQGIDDQTGIRDYLISGTEFGISLSDIPRKEGSGTVSVEYADSMLRNVSSNWTDWEVILSENRPPLKYPMENEYEYLSGQLRNFQKTDSAAFVLMCSPGRHAQFQYALADTSGYFTIPLNLDHGEKDIILMPDLVTGSSGINLEPTFLDFSTGIKPVRIPADMPAFIPRWSVNYQVRKIYGIPETVKGADSVASPAAVRFYGKPDFELNLSDYISLPLMDEVFYEILPHVSIKKDPSGNRIIITDRIDNRPVVMTPCLMIDGVIISDPDLIIDMDPEIVEKIDVIREKYFIGRYVFPGIVNVITKAADFSSVPVPGYMARIPYHVFDVPEPIAMPDYTVAENRTSRIPDYRNTLFWNPEIHFTIGDPTQVTFWSSDNNSDYSISVQGILDDGTLFSAHGVISVR